MINIYCYFKEANNNRNGDSGQDERENGSGVQGHQRLLCLLQWSYHEQTTRSPNLLPQVQQIIPTSPRHQRRRTRPHRGKLRKNTLIVQQKEIRKFQNRRCFQKNWLNKRDAAIKSLYV